MDDLAAIMTDTKPVIPLTSEQSEYEHTVSGHASYYTQLLQRTGPQLRGAGRPDGGAAQLAALNWLRLELDNLLEAIDTLINRDDATGLLPHAENLSWILDMAGQHRLQVECYRDLAAHAERLNHLPLLSEALLGLGVGCSRQGDTPLGREVGKRALDLARELDRPAAQAWALNALGRLAYTSGEYSAARDLCQEAGQLFAALGDRHGQAAALGNIANADWMQSELALARERGQESLALRESCGDLWGSAAALNNLAIVEEVLGNFDAAECLHKQSLSISRDFGDLNSAAWSLMNLGAVAVRRGAIQQAGTLLEQSLSLLEEQGDLSGQCICRNNLAVILEESDTAAARAMYESVLSLGRQIDDLHAQVMALFNMAMVDYGLGSYGAAIRGHAAALELRLDMGDKIGCAVSCLAGGAALCAVNCWRSGTLALHGGVSQAAALGYGLQEGEALCVAECRAKQDAAVACSEISADDLASWKTEGEAMSLDELAEFTLAALREARVGLEPDEGGAS